MNDPLELAGREEPLPELTAELLSEENAEPGAPVVSVPSWLRLAYALEFLIALNVILNLWSEIGGEGHLDLMPWYTKLACIAGLAWCCVRFTAGIVEQKRVWTRRTITWFGGILLMGIVMGGITYYYHLHEEPDDDDDDATAASVHVTAPGVFLHDACQGKDSRYSICFLEHPGGRLEN